MLYCTAKLLTILSVAALSSASFVDVDPNTLSCDPAGQIFLLLPHYEDCSKYYTCDHGNEVEFSCPAGLIFDFVLQTCNWDWATTCVLRTKEDDDVEGSGSEWEEEIEGSGEEWQEDESPSQSRAMPVFHAPLIDCANPVDSGRQVAYKGDCQRYWRCQNGAMFLQYCTDGLFFNDQTQQCDFEANVKCLVETEDELNGEFIVY